MNTDTATANVLTAPEVIGLSKAINKAATDAARATLKPGTYKGTVRVDVNFSLKVGEDYNQEIVEKAQPWTLLAVALSKLNGVTVEALVREAILLPEEQAEAIKKSADKAISELKTPTDTPCKGKVTGTVVVTKVVPS